jgi:hypothetical protein
MLFEVWVVSLLMGGLTRLVPPLMATCIGCFGDVMWSNDLTGLVSASKQQVMSGCLEVRKSCRGVGPLGRLTVVLTSKPC